MTIKIYATTLQLAVCNLQKTNNGLMTMSDIHYLRIKNQVSKNHNLRATTTVDLIVSTIPELSFNASKNII